jgi:hypothetical protein
VALVTVVQITDDPRLPSGRRVYVVINWVLRRYFRRGPVCIAGASGRNPMAPVATEGIWWMSLGSVRRTQTSTTSE